MTDAERQRILEAAQSPTGILSPRSLRSVVIEALAQSNTLSSNARNPIMLDTHSDRQLARLWVEHVSSDRPETSQTYVNGYVHTETTEIGNAEIETESPIPWVPFPVDCLPEPAADLVRAQAAAQGCDPALVAMSTLAVLAAAVGNSWRVEIKGGWQAPSTLWTLVIDSSGGGKSPAMRAAVAPILALESEERESYKDRLQEYETRLLLWKDNKNRLESERPSKPTPRRRYRIGDVTVESVVALHEENTRGLILYRDEAAAWLGSFDRYAKGESDMQTWIELYEGHRITVDRKGGEKRVLDIERPAVCVLGGIQPSILQRTLQPNHFSSGFEPRLLFAYPPQKGGEWTEAEVTIEVYTQYADLINHLYADEGKGDGEPWIARFSSEAKSLYVDFFNESYQYIRELPDGALRSAYVKNRETAARLALILHLSDSRALEPSEISPDAMERGIRLAKWLRYESHRVHHVLGFTESSMSADERLVHTLPPSFTAADIAQQKGVTNRMGRNIASELVGLGLIEEIPSSGKTKHYRTTPKAQMQKAPPPVIS